MGYATARAGTAGAAMLLLLSGATAQPVYPSKQINVIVPFSAGGVTDIVARIVFEKVSLNTGATSIVDDRIGAGGALGMQAAAHAPADGYTVVFGDPAGSAAANVTLYPSVLLNPLKDLTPVALVGITSAVLVVPTDLPPQTFAEFEAYSAQKKGMLTYGSVGAGTPGHLNAELLKQRTGIDGTHVPYRAISQGMTDLITGRLAYWIPPLPTALPYIRNGKLRALAISGEMRAPELPDVPTFAELGVKDFDVSSTYAVFVPQGTPPENIAKLYSEIKTAVGDEKVAKRLKLVGVDAKVEPAAQVTALLEKNVTLWANVIKRAGISLNNQ